jgi:hypothetical protein
MKSYVLKNRKNHGRAQKRLLDVVRSELVSRRHNDDDDGECKGRKYDVLMERIVIDNVSEDSSSGGRELLQRNLNFKY